ncbi:MAG TPA: thiopurine S-methyltransferase [Rhodobacteraceae bacterium]|jgi:thiopurine S-methyltransferase|nr:thiopurine S-methyltransferase [Paracoccaceae bacterium]|tara:strand:+ start:2051 stop:2689 length:639 start_codon:yes stop_codon:yes gene_type:complete
MDPNFWHKRWEKNEIGFHQSAVNVLLSDHFSGLSLPQTSRVFVPLCGKTRDIAWLLSQGHRVVGVELSKLAVEELFVDLGVAPKISVQGELLRYSAPGLEIFVGDIFELSGDLLGRVDAIYDRAALVAFPTEMRGRYGAHVAAITQLAPQFLICFEYDQAVMNGPPFSIDRQKVHDVYGAHYQIEPITNRDVAGGLKGKCPAQETVWHLVKS